jgi:hypothetical protein
LKFTPELQGLFKRWRTPPAELRESLAELWKSARSRSVELARSCLEEELSPPLSPPTAASLREMAQGTFPLHEG